MKLWCPVCSIKLSFQTLESSRLSEKLYPASCSSMFGFALGLCSWGAGYLGGGLLTAESRWQKSYPSMLLLLRKPPLSKEHPKFRWISLAVRITLSRTSLLVLMVSLPDNTNMSVG